MGNIRSLGKMLAACGLLALAGPATLAAGPDPIPPSTFERLQSNFIDNTLVVHWGIDASDSHRLAVLSTIDGSIVGTAADGAQVVRAGVGAGFAQTLLAQFPPTVVAGVESSDIFLGNQLGLNALGLQSLTITPHTNGRVLVPVILDGGLYTLELAPFSSRAANFKVFIDDGSGQLVEIEPPAPKTWRGRVIEMPGSVVAASIDNGLSASILLHDNVQDGWFIQPITDVLAGVAGDVHIVYHGNAVREMDVHCGGGLLPDLGGFNPIDPQMDGTFRGPGFKICEMAYDADFQFYQQNGSNTNNTIADIENVQNGMIIVYERDCNVTFTTTQIIVRTSSASNPYTSNVADTLLTQFRNHWNANHGNVHRDLAHLMTGRNMGGVLGIAWLSVVCVQNTAYGVSRSRFTTAMASRIALTAHEVGHNFSANHCSGSTCKIMCASLGGCGGIGLPNFSPAEASVITNYANGRPCLANTGPPPNDPPSVFITTPFSGAQFNQGDPIFFSVIADDPQDGNIAANVLWSSSINGVFGAGASFTYSNLAVGTHTITASVTDSGGLSANHQVSITINGTVVNPPDRPAKPTVTDQGNGSVLVQWIDLPNETAWDVQRQEKVGGVWTNSTIVGSNLPANTTSFVNNPGGFGDWRYRIRAKNSAGTSQWSVWQTITLIDPNITIPNQPAQPTATHTGGGNVLVSWTDLPNESYWRIQRQQNVGGTWTNSTVLNNNLPQNTTSYNDAPGSGQFRYRIRAGNVAGLSPWSPWRTITVP